MGQDYQRTSALFSIPKHAHISAEAMQKKPPRRQKESTEETASLLGLTQLQVSTNHCYSKPANSKGKG